MQQIRGRMALVSMGLICLVAGWITLTPAAALDDASDPAVERTRKTVRMLDDIYKTTVVLVTEHYVNDDEDLPAGTAAIALFDAIRKKGWHDVRLLDSTGEPISDKNVARDDFDREAIRQFKAGKQWYDKVETKGDKRTLRAATPIPVVMKKCTMCHPNYENVTEGAAIGLLSYTIPVE